MDRLKKVFIIYASVFAGVWLAYGLYLVVTDQPNATSVLLFGIAFSVVMYAAAWFSHWITKHYKKVDMMAKEMIANSKKG